MEDAAWMARYSRNRDGEVVPWDIIEQQMRCTHPFRVLTLRAMLAVPYFERALYELDDADVTAEKILSLVHDVESNIQGSAPRPLMSVPHILADESSCYYHGY